MLYIFFWLFELNIWWNSRCHGQTCRIFLPFRLLSCLHHKTKVALYMHIYIYIQILKKESYIWEMVSRSVFFINFLYHLLKSIYFFFFFLLNHLFKETLLHIFYVFIFISSPSSGFSFIKTFFFCFFFVIHTLDKKKKNTTIIILPTSMKFLGPLYSSSSLLFCLGWAWQFLIDGITTTNKSFLIKGFVGFLLSGLPSNPLTVPTSNKWPCCHPGDKLMIGISLKSSSGTAMEFNFAASVRSPVCVCVSLCVCVRG